MRFLVLLLFVAVPQSFWAQGTINFNPTVRIVEPVSNVTVYSLSNSVTLRAEASDPDGTIAEVRLLENGSVIATDLQAPYEFLYKAATFGTYTLEVQAVDNLGGRGSQTRVVEYVRVTDNYGPGIPISAGTNLTLRATTVEATRQKGEPNHAGASGGRSVWWVWRPTVSGTVSIDTFGSDFDTVLGVYTNVAGLQTGPITNLVTIAASDDDPANPPLSRVKFAALAMQTYYIAVDGRDGFAGNVVLNIRQSRSPAAANDFLAFATRMVAGTQTTTNIGATKQAGEPHHAGNPGGASVWWRYDGDSLPFPVLISTAGSTFDTLLAVYTNAVAFSREPAPLMENLRLVVSNDDAGSSTNRTSLVEFIPRIGTTYWIAVDGYNGAEGSVRIAINRQAQQGPRPTNDAFINAAILRGGSVISNLNTFFATSEFGEPPQIAPKLGAKSVWYRWIAPATGPVHLTTKWSDFDTLLAVFMGTNITTLTHIASNDDDGGLPTSAFTFQAVEGAEYRIAVAGFQGAGGDLVLTLNQPLIVLPRITTSFLQGRIALSAAHLGGRFVLERSPDLINWSFLAEVESGFLLEDMPNRDTSMQFYRLREVQD
jgi:hypothetical protein